MEEGTQGQLQGRPQARRVLLREPRLGSWVDRDWDGRDRGPGEPSGELSRTEAGPSRCQVGPDALSPPAAARGQQSRERMARAPGRGRPLVWRLPGLPLTQMPWRPSSVAGSHSGVPRNKALSPDCQLHLLGDPQPDHPLGPLDSPRRDQETKGPEATDLFPSVEAAENVREYGRGEDRLRHKEDA